MKKTPRFSFLVVLLILTACGLLRPAELIRDPTSETAPSATAAVPTAAPKAISYADIPVSDLFNLPWEDRSVFRTALRPDEQHWINELPHASLYRVELTLPQALDVLSGRQEVVYTNQEETALHEVVFRLFPNINGGRIQVENLRINGQPAQGVLLHQESALVLQLEEPLQPGQSILIQLDFSLEIPREMGGNYGLFGYFDEVLMLDLFLPTIPVYEEDGWYSELPPRHGDLSCYDASFYLVRVSAPQDLLLAASGVETGRELIEDLQRITYAIGPARDFSLAASEDFTLKSETFNGVTVNSYAFAGFEEAQDLALEEARQAIAFFSEEIGVYPYTEFDVAATPMQAGGIEYPGMTWINRDYYALDSAENRAAAYGVLRGVIVHEVAHQWFYNTVGNSQVDEPWLDEALVQYLTGQYFLDVYGQGAFESVKSSWDARWSNIGFDETPIGLESDAYEGYEYVAAVYGRGPYFFEALSDRMGEATFDAFLRDYYDAFHWQVATAEDLKDLAEQRCACDLTDLFNQWVYP